MCARCDFISSVTGMPFPTNCSLECSWCDQEYRVCEVALGLTRAGKLTRLCGKHRAEISERRQGDFGATRRNKGHEDEERDVDANGWLSNAMRLLEDPGE